MQIHYARIVRHISRLPRHWQILLSVMACLVLLSQAEQFGEKLGKALYYLTH
jgi:hypothetical protein